MSFYTGQPYCAGTVCIGAPVVEQILVTPIAPDVVGDVRHYLASSPTAHDELYFCIYEEGAPVGQIVLHDINWATGESLIGYCLFRPELRGRGVGTLALRLLQQFVVGAGRLTQLVIITGSDNLASQAIARKCGFALRGGAWEDPEKLVVYTWLAPDEH